MLRSLIAHVFFLFAMAAISSAGLPSARAEMPLEAWLSMAADSLDQQISQQTELSWQELDAIGQRAAESFGRVMDQCRMGVGGRRGLQLAQAIDLLVGLRKSGVTRVVAPAKNFSCPAESFEDQRCRIVLGNARSHQLLDSKAAAPPISASVVENLSAILGRKSEAHRLIHSTLTQLATQSNDAVAQLEEAVYGPAEPLVQAAGQAWDQWMTASADRNRAQLSDSSLKTREKSTLSDVSGRSVPGLLMNYWLEVSNFAQAKLNWLTSKVRHFAKAYLKSIEPQFLILEFDPMA